MAELLTAAAAADPVRAVKEALRRWAGLKPYVRSPEPKGARPADVARELLAAHVGTRAAAAILRERCSLSARQARRVVRAAADMRGQTMAALTRSMWP